MKNAYAKKLIEKKKQREAETELQIMENMRAAQMVNERQCLDAMIIALNEELGLGKSRIDRLIDKYVETRTEVAELVDDDYFNNKDISAVWSTTKIDRALKRIMGDDYPSMNERFLIHLDEKMFEGGIVIR